MEEIQEKGVQISANNVKIEIMKIVVAVTEFISLIVVILQFVKELV